MGHTAPAGASLTTKFPGDKARKAGEAAVGARKLTVGGPICC